MNRAEREVNLAYHGEICAIKFSVRFSIAYDRTPASKILQPTRGS